MKYENRKEKMLKLLKNSEIVNMKTLVEELGSSEATIRRDIVRMEKEGLIKRYWGGIQRLDNADNERSRGLKNLFKEDLNGIGAYAAAQVEEGDLIYIGSGTTTLSMIRYFEDNEKITVVTNGIPQLEALHEKGIQALLLCGFYKAYSQSVVGKETSSMLAQYQFDIAFIGANGIGEDYSLLSADYYEDSLKDLAIRNSRKTYCLVRSDKFERKAYYRISPNRAKDVILVTDKPDKDEEKWAKGEGVYHAQVKELGDD